MCIDCARNKLKILVPTFGVTRAWYICVRDHSAHIHIRVTGDDDERQSSEWVQVNSTFDVFKQAMNETGVRHDYHVHELEPAPTGVPANVVARIPHSVLTAADAAGFAADDEICAICFDAFRAGETVTSLPCAHRYHASCIGSWLKAKTTCPRCRTEVTADGLSAVGSPPGRVYERAEEPVERWRLPVEVAAVEQERERRAAAATNTPLVVASAPLIDFRDALEDLPTSRSVDLTAVFEDGLARQQAALDAVVQPASLELARRESLLDRLVGCCGTRPARRRRW